MIIRPSSYADADHFGASANQKLDKVTASMNGLSVGGDAPTTAHLDTVSLKTSSTNASETRSLKVAQLRDNIESGQYRVSATALAGSMIEKAKAGSAPELSFLTDL